MGREHMLNSCRLYEIAYNAHYKLKNLKSAYSLYQQLINLFPVSEESEYAKAQMNNIESMIGRDFLNESAYLLEIEKAEKIANGENIQIEYGEALSEARKNYIEKKQLRNGIMLTTGYSFDGCEVEKYIDVIFCEKFVGFGLKTS